MVEFLLDIQEIRRPESIYKLTANWWSSIKDLKDKICSLTHEPPSRQHIFHSTNPVELHNNQILHDLGIEQSGRMLRVAIDYRTRQDFTLTPTKGVLIDDACKEMLRNVRLGLQKNRVPKITDELEGSGGVYFLRSATGAYEAVFKPHDEEQGMPANPKDHAGAGKEGLREHFQPGQGCLRELAAYIMDFRNFCRVPATTLVHCEHAGFHYPASGRSKVGKGDPYPKLGSLQRFIGGADSFENVGQGFLSDIEVQKIALLDMRILNCDRNSANILVKYTREQENYGDVVDGEDHITFVSSDSDDATPSPYSSPVTGSGRKTVSTKKSSMYELYPIDHGYAMPSRLKIFEWDWAWLYYPQVDRPVTPEIVSYMEELNIDELLQKLEPQVPLSDDSLFLLRLSHFLILHGIRAGLTLKDIAMIIARSNEEVASKLELSVEEAEENAHRFIEQKASSHTKGPSYMLSSLYNTSPRSTTSNGSINNSPRSAVDVSPCKSSSKDDLPAFPLAISLDLMRAQDDDSIKISRDRAASCDDHTTHDTDSPPLSARSSPTPTQPCESSHAVNHSPMRPHLPSSSSWNSFSSFNVSQHPLHSYAVKSSGDTSLGMSPRSKDVESKYLPQPKCALVVVLPPGALTIASPAASGEQNDLCHETVPSPTFRRPQSLELSASLMQTADSKLSTIVEYARERGLSSMSTGSAASRESDVEILTEALLPGKCAPATSVLMTIPSVSEVEEEPGSEWSPLSSPGGVMQSCGSSDSLGGMYVDLGAPLHSGDFLRHVSLPRNALTSMLAAGSGMEKLGGPVAVAPSAEKPGMWKPSHSRATVKAPEPVERQSFSEMSGVHVELGIPLSRRQHSIDSSQTPVYFDHSNGSWIPDKHSPYKAPKLTPSALIEASASRSDCNIAGSSGLIGMSRPLAKIKSSVSIGSGSGSGSGEDFSSDYGFFKSMKDGEFSATASTLGEEGGLPMNYGEFNGLDLPSTSGHGKANGDFDNLCVPVPLMRVVSFSGFESAPVYNNIFAGTMGNLRLERRKAVAKTPEFMQLRMQFAQEHVAAIIQRMAREKRSGDVSKKGV